MEKGGNSGKSSRQKKQTDENAGKGGKNQKKTNQGGNQNKPQYAPKANAKENTAPNDQVTKMDDLTDDILLKESEQSTDPQKLQNDLAYWQTRVSCIFQLTFDCRPLICKVSWKS